MCLPWTSSVFDGTGQFLLQQSPGTGLLAAHSGAPHLRLSAGSEPKRHRWDAIAEVAYSEMANKPDCLESGWSIRPVHTHFHRQVVLVNVHGPPHPP